MGKRKGDSGREDEDLRKRAGARLRPADAEMQKLAKEEPQRLIEELRTHQVELEIQNENLRESQQRLEEAIERHRDLFDFAPVGYVVLDGNGVIVEANLTVAGMLGIERGYVAGKALDLFVAQTSKETAFEHRRKVFGGAAADAELRLLRKDGGTFLVHIHSRPALDADGNVSQCRSSLIDITARKEAEAAIHDMARFPEEAPNPIMRVRPEGTLVYANGPARGLLERMGWKEGELVPAEFIKPVRRTFENGHTEAFEFTCESAKTFSFFVAPAFKADEVNIYGYDISGRVAAEEDLSRAQAIAHAGSWRMDVKQNVLTWSDETYRIFERPKGEPQTYESFLECVHPDDRTYVDKKWQAALRGEDYDIEHRILVGGKVKWVREKAYMEFDDDWNLLGGFGIAQDITRQKLAEEELRRNNEELDRFNKAAVGREMRIIEMKKEVNELCERLGEPRRYPLKFMDENEIKENENGKEEAEGS